MGIHRVYMVEFDDGSTIEYFVPRPTSFAGFMESAFLPIVKTMESHFKKKVVGVWLSRMLEKYQAYAEVWTSRDDTLMAPGEKPIFVYVGKPD